MPEEVNRVLTDRVSDLLLTPSSDAANNLMKEGIARERIVFVGNVMIDSLFDSLPRARSLEVAMRHGLTRGGYALVTLHRPANVDHAAQLAILLDTLNALAVRMPVAFPVHPRTRNAMEVANLADRLGGVIQLDPLGYLEMLSLTDGAGVVLTDSGGLQEETSALGIPCVTLREQTERPVTIERGTNRLAPWPLTTEGVLSAVNDALQGRAEDKKPIDGWDGHAADRIVAELIARTTRMEPVPL
jgi:UDP-N-acetylglucosamine 2-epimerase (non-hydrolysing)